MTSTSRPALLTLPSLTALGFTVLAASGCGGSVGASPQGTGKGAQSTDGGGDDAGGNGGDAGMTPSSLITVPLQACEGLIYLADVAVGSEDFQMIVDTGSTSLGVASSMCSGCGVTPVYTPGASAVDQKTMATSQFGTGSWSGEVYQDSIGFASDPAVPVKFVAIDSQSMFFRPGLTCSGGATGYQGIIGFDRVASAVSGTNAFFDDFVTAKGIPNVFATELCDNSGTLWLGGYDSSKATGAPQYTPFTSDQASPYYYTVNLQSIAVDGTTTTVTPTGLLPDTVVDTGTTAFIVDSAAFTSLTTAIAGTPGFTQTFGASAGGASWFSGQTPCGAAGTSKAQIDAAMPGLTLTFGGGVTLKMPASESYLTSYSGYWCSLLIAAPSGQQFPLAALLGSPMMRSQIIIWDRAGGRLGFAPHAPCQ
jgi:Eukaryotic aspartyl protease